MCTGNENSCEVVFVRCRADYAQLHRYLSSTHTHTHTSDLTSIFAIHFATYVHFAQYGIAERCLWSIFDCIVSSDITVEPPMSTLPGYMHYTITVFDVFGFVIESRCLDWSFDNSVDINWPRSCYHMNFRRCGTSYTRLRSSGMVAVRDHVRENV